MRKEYQKILTDLLNRHRELGISEQIDYDKFYLYSLITHSTAIEGSTVTEVEAQLLFDEGITSGKRTIHEMNMNLDLKAAYDYGREWIRRHPVITVDSLITLAAKVMSRTGSEYYAAGGSFDASKGHLRKLNVTAGFGGKSYMSYLKVPQKLEEFCKELNERRQALDSSDAMAVYDLSFWAHYELVTIHPWADGNGRCSRLLMNLLQMEYDVLPTKVLTEEKAEYIQSLIDSREEEEISIFQDCMTRLHCAHVKKDIEQYLASVTDKSVDRAEMEQELTDKWSLNPYLADKLADILQYLADKSVIRTEMLIEEFALSDTTARRYLRILTELGYLEAHGGNKNRTYGHKAN